jgi:hypothetical protein
MSLKMANGDEGGIAAWQIQDGSDASTGSHDQKMSSFETMMMVQQPHGFVRNQTTSSNGIGDASIVNADADRPLPANFLSNFPSSVNFGMLPTDATEVTQSTVRSCADTTSAFLLPNHHNEDNKTGLSYSCNTTICTPNTTTATPSDYHLDLSSLITSAKHNQTSLLTSGTPDAGVEARMNSGILSHVSNQVGTLQQATNPNNIISNGDRTAAAATPPHTLTTITTSAQEVSRDGNTSGHPSSTTMGYNDVGNSSWALDLEDNKMDRMTPEGKNRDGDESTVQSTAVLSTGTGEGDGDQLSPASTPRMGPAAGPAHDSEGGNVIGTPSTVSTAPSTEDASLGADSIDKIGLKLDPSHIEPFTLHRRAPSWDRSPVPTNLYTNTEITEAHSQSQPTLHQIPNAESSQYWLPQQHPAPAPASAFSRQQQQHLQQAHAAPAPSPWGGSQSRVASFRQEGVPDSNKHDSRAGYPMAQMPQQHGDRWHQPPRPFAGESQLPYPSQQVRGVHMQETIGSHGYRTTNQGFNPYQVHPRGKAGYPPQHQLPPAQSPQRNPRGAPRPQGPSPHRGQQQSGGGPTAATSSGSGSSRSSSEILKTLLRKKACLYEPDTSRAVALVTWLVGRELALEYGFFSRQQLQAGVHACVAKKIETGTITRTKVNRCMQIILNSCFHYIIPRPDGTEEKGHAFRETFKQEVSDDADLLQLLPEPWNDLTVDRDTVLQASLAEGQGSQPEPRGNQASPKVSPNLKPAGDRSPVRERDICDGDNSDSKRAVLLCFNENVRAAEDVFRCHNEFIRDSAHSSNLQLTAQEWRIFFGKEAASAPRIWGNVGIPVVAVDSPNGGARKVDVLGQMTSEEAGKFRTTWCAKRYDHDHDFCGMAHVEINGGWLRRNPNVRWYKDEFCPSIIKMVDKRISPNYFVINECPKGADCEFAHSYEEMTYHPNRYKSKVCPGIMRAVACRFGDICPNHHPSDSARPPKKGEGRPPSTRHGRAAGQSSSGGGKNTAALPLGSPILYASPAPVSSFEKHLLMPGLQNMFRRQCTVVRAHLRNPKCRCCYSYFGDDSGIDKEATRGPSPGRPGLPSSLRM